MVCHRARARGNAGTTDIDASGNRVRCQIDHRDLIGRGEGDVGDFESRRDADAPRVKTSRDHRFLDELFIGDAKDSHLAGVCAETRPRCVGREGEGGRMLSANTSCKLSPSARAHQ